MLRSCSVVEWTNCCHSEICYFCNLLISSKEEDRYLGHPLVFATMLLGSNYEPYGKAQYSFLLMYKQKQFGPGPVPITISPTPHMPGQWGPAHGLQVCTQRTRGNQVIIRSMKGLTNPGAHCFYGRLTMGKCFYDDGS